MNNDPNRPLFLEQRSYRQRRIRDIAKVLPLLAAALWLLPLGWGADGPAGATTGSVSQYIFGSWLLLIAATAIVSRRIKSGDADAPQSGNDV